MGYYRGDYYRGDPGPVSAGPGMLQRLIQQHGISRAEAERLTPGIVAKEDVRSGREGMGEPGSGVDPLAESRYRHGRGRRMNALNPRALRRSMRRVQAFAKFASRTMSFTKRHKLKKHRRR